MIFEKPKRKEILCIILLFLYFITLIYIIYYYRNKFVAENQCVKWYGGNKKVKRSKQKATKLVTKR